MSWISDWWRAVVAWFREQFDDEPVPLPPDDTPDPQPDPPPQPAKVIHAGHFCLEFGWTKHDDNWRRVQLDRMQSFGMTTVYVLVTSTAAKGNLLYGEKQKWEYWKPILDEIYRRGMLAIPWLADNNSDDINKRSMEWWSEYVRRVVADFDPHPAVAGYCTGCETEEYWDSGKSQAIITALKTRTQKEVGFHTSPGTTYLGWGRNADVWYAQMASVDALTSEGRAAELARAFDRAWGKRWYAAEWCRYERCGEERFDRVGTAILKASALCRGVGCGCTREGLAALALRSAQEGMR